jgi:hypothetical protein
MYPFNRVISVGFWNSVPGTVILTEKLLEERTGICLNHFLSANFDVTFSIAPIVDFGILHFCFVKFLLCSVRGATVLGYF